jgi:hypothetical protein
MPQPMLIGVRAVYVIDRPDAQTSRSFRHATSAHRLPTVDDFVAGKR